MWPRGKLQHSGPLMANRQGPTVLDRFLRVFADVKPGEAALVLLLTLNIFLILGAYYVLKPMRDALIVNESLFGIDGDQLKSYLSALLAFVAIPAVGYYAALTTRMSRVRLINMTSAFVVVCVIMFFAVSVAGARGVSIGILYFVWLGIINVFIIAQFWSYANDVYTEAQGKRLFAIVGIGQSLGAIAGSKLVNSYGKQYMYELFISAALVLAVCMLLYNVVDRLIAARGTGFADQEHKKKAVTKPLSKGGGFALVLKSRYLFFIGLMILVANLVNSTGEFILSNAARQDAARQYPDTMYTAEWVRAVEGGSLSIQKEVRADGVRIIANENERVAKIKDWRRPATNAFYGGFYFWVNVAGALIQMLLVSRFFKYFGVRAGLFVLPVVATLGAGMLSIVGTVLAVRIAKTAENSTDYSLQNTLKQALFLPTSREEKYKAKAAIDVFFVRLGDALSALLVYVGTEWLLFGAKHFALVNVALGVAWIFICIQIFRSHKKLVPDDRIASQ